MCVIIMKPAGVALPTRAIFEDCFDTNPDGFGMCWSDGKTVTLDKGYMDMDSAWFAMNKVATDHAAVFHFRISTGGLVDSGACHPYPVSADHRQLRQLYMQGLPYAVAHNGVIGKGGAVLNDTQLWIQHDLVKCMGNRYTTSIFLDAEAKDHSSRFVILYGDGTYHLAGEWTEKDGLFFSNMLWDWDSWDWRPSRKRSPARVTDEEWLNWYKTYEEAVEDGYAPVCPVCGGYNTIPHIESYLDLCECRDCSAVYDGVTGDVYTLDRGVREDNKTVRSAAYYGGGR